MTISFRRGTGAVLGTSLWVRRRKGRFGDNRPSDLIFTNFVEYSCPYGERRQEAKVTAVGVSEPVGSMVVRFRVTAVGASNDNLRAVLRANC